MMKGEETRLANLQAKKKDGKYPLTGPDTIFLKRLTAKKKDEGLILKHFPAGRAQ
jgi:hypothetical protein